MPSKALADFKIVITDAEFADLSIEHEVAAARGFTLTVRQCRTEADLIREGSDADGLVNQYAQITKTVIDSLQNCQVISRYGIGLNTIDVDAATAAGIQVANVADGSLEEVSDHAVAMLLSSARGLDALSRSTQAGRWNYAAAGRLRRIKGKTLGLLGFGRIPQLVAHKMAGFGVELIAFDPYCDPTVAAGFGVTLVPFNEVLARADYISVHTPLLPDTLHLLGSAQFALMKPTTVVINTSRGPVIDEAALVTALKTGKIRGAYLDVLESEPLAAANPLLELDNVMITPHTAWYSEDSERDIRSRAVTNVLDVLEGLECSNTVNRAGLQTAV
jgi:D-3-phosphoglycerate dehydrogenase